MWSDCVTHLAENCVRQTHVRVFDIVTPVFASGAHLLLRTFARPLAPPFQCCLGLDVWWTKVIAFFNIEMGGKGGGYGDGVNNTVLDYFSQGGLQRRRFL